MESLFEHHRPGRPDGERPPPERGAPEPAPAVGADAAEEDGTRTDTDTGEKTAAPAEPRPVPASGASAGPAAVSAAPVSTEDLGTVLSAVGRRRTDDDWLERAGLVHESADGDAPGEQQSFGFAPTADSDAERRPPSAAEQPLAARMRPRSLDDYIGQAPVVGEGTPLRALLDQADIHSVILWGPPGSGKTSLAHVIAAHVSAAWQELSAVAAGVRDVRRVIDEARTRLEATGRKTVLFLDEIHRFNKSQQDALLPAVENGWIVLVGATTENPFFELNAPLMSRCQLIQLAPLEDDDIRRIVRRALLDASNGFAGTVGLSPEAERAIVAIADGDARLALNTLEAAAHSARGGTDAAVVTVTEEHLRQAEPTFRYDRDGDAHYDQVSAFIKSMRGSDPDAAVYWLLRMLEAGEDARFLARRMIIFASEDVGLADPRALTLAVDAFQALDRVGLPEARHNLVQAAIGLAVAPKSNAVAEALRSGLDLARRHPNAAVPVHLRDSHYAGAEQLGHGEGYEYPHDHPGGFVVQQYLPDTVEARRLYHPTTSGEEREIAERLAVLRERIDTARRRRHSASAVGQAGHIQGIRKQP